MSVTKLNKNMTGSGSIGSGGYGCVFLPSLQCDTEMDDNNEKIDNAKYVTKLMTNNHADIEYRLIRSFDRRLNVIPNYADYFLVTNVSKCRPKKLTKRDLHGYEKQCKPLIKKNITRKNINRSLNKITALRIPYGGDTIDEYWMKHINNRSDMKTMIASMYILFNKGILPMNQIGLYHGDVKSSNIMYYQNKAKLIDWGLAFDSSYKRDHNADGVSRLATYRPFQFNLPPSCILFNAEFRAAISGLLKTHDESVLTRETLTDFVAGFITDWYNIRGHGSISLLVTLYDKLVPYAAKKCDITYTYARGSYNTSDKGESVPAFAVVYITNILEQFIRDKKLHLEEYYKEVYLKSLDLWGFAISFIILFNLMCTNDATLNINERKTMCSLCNMFIYILEMDKTPIDSQRISNYIKNVQDNYHM